MHSMQLDPDAAIIWKRGIQRGLTTLRREREWGTTLGVLIGTLLLFQMVLIILLGMQGMQSLLKSRTDIRLEVLPSATNQQVGEFFSVLQQQEFVEDAAFITKEQAYERAKEYDPELIAFLEEFAMGNPFPDTVGVTLRSLDDYMTFRRYVEQEQWNGIIDPTFLSEVTDQEAQVTELLRFTKAGRSLTLLVLSLVGAVLLFITTELVRRRVLGRSNEVLVEKLVGASPLSMFVPFATEACVLIGIATIASLLLSMVLLFLLPSMVPALQNGGVLSALSAEVSPLLRTALPQYFLSELFLIPVIAAAGTWFGMKRELLARTLSLHTL